MPPPPPERGRAPQHWAESGMANVMDARVQNRETVGGAYREFILKPLSSIYAPNVFLFCFSVDLWSFNPQATGQICNSIDALTDNGIPHLILSFTSS
jgi:hypothetical protein